jgi:hypothetical protein
METTEYLGLFIYGVVIWANAAQLSRCNMLTDILPFATFGASEKRAFTQSVTDDNLLGTVQPVGSFA